MKPIVRYALLLSAVVIAGGGIAAAQMDKKPAGQMPSYAKAYPASGHARGAAKFFRYDLNHDGKVTRDEMNRVLAQEFSQIAGSAPAIGQAQFIAYRMKDLRAHTQQMFRRADWNNDGRLSLEEYITSERTRFERADRAGTGVVSCGAQPSHAKTGSQRRGRSGGRGFCKVADLNHDGQVTHAEFDKAMQQEFAAAAKGGSLSEQAYFSMIAAHVQASDARKFARLDNNHDGKVDRSEFAASQTRYFTRLDRNHDGVVTRDEFYAGRRTASAYHRKPDRG
ncbi:MAG: EF-hand domain-containing protein [Proteobacteria bacterium]|nr:EF-hand domain-containing protein [Pseudomonadota bacterium]